MHGIKKWEKEVIKIYIMSVYLIQMIITKHIHVRQISILQIRFLSNYQFTSYSDLDLREMKLSWKYLTQADRGIIISFTTNYKCSEKKKRCIWAYILNDCFCLQCTQTGSNQWSMSWYQYVDIKISIACIVGKLQCINAQPVCDINTCVLQELILKHYLYL